jgi:hypothetical protein
MLSENNKRFTLYAGGIIFLFTIMLILRWHWMPTFIDIYYHLLTMLNIKQCSGISAFSFWEYAPFGRPHLYPPLLHILMFIVYKFFPDVVTVARIFELLSFPLTLTVIFVTIRSIFNNRLAFWTVLLAASMYSFYLSSVDFLAATLSLLLSLLTFYAFEKNRLIAAVAFLSLSLYSQTSISLFFVLGLFIYGVLRREKLYRVLGLIISALILYSPLLIHQLHFISYIDTTRIQENFPFEINLFAYILAGFGLVKSIRQRKEYSFFVALFIAGLLFLPLRYRFFSGQGMIGIIFLAALTLDIFYEKICRKATRTNRAFIVPIYLLIAVLAMLLISPSMTIKGQKVFFNPIGATYMQIFPSQQARQRTNEISIYLPKSFAPVFDVVNKQTTPQDLIASNFEYLAGFISVFTQRRTSSAMLAEIRPFKEVSPFSYARLIIWLKDPDNLTRQPQGLIDKLGLIKIAETGVFFIYKNPNIAAMSIERCKPIVPLWLCVGLLAGLAGMAIVDLARGAPFSSCKA